MHKSKSICISFLGNAYHDSRIINLTNSLKSDGFDVKVFSFDWETENFNSIIGEISVFKISKKHSSLRYYLDFSKILIKNLIHTNCNIYLAEDVYTLPFVSFIAKLKGARLIYNSRELYAFIGGLRNKKRIQSFIGKLERFFIKKVDLVLTTGELDSKFLIDYYKIYNTLVIRNLPLLNRNFDRVNLHRLLDIDNGQKILLYQGVILEGRGIELLIKELPKISNVHFVIIGGGPFRDKFEKAAVDYNVEQRVHFLGKIEHSKLLNYTACADAGVAFIENISVSYYHALPNKLFEYIMAGIPVLSSNLPQMKKVIEDYQVGEVIDLESDNLAERINSFFMDPEKFEKIRDNCIKASQELNWQTEYQKVKFDLLGIENKNEKE